MKHILLIAIIIGLGILTRAESEYTVTNDGTCKILKGLISRDMLEKDATFSWFHQNRHAYAPDAALTTLVHAKTAQVRFLVFTATWNEDAQYIIPRFYSLMDAAAVRPDQVTLIGVDKEKKTLYHLTETMHITSIPTFIVLKDGKEIGRIQPKDKYTPWEKELAVILETH
ncbi:MAG TPA: thioredoxin family protein [Puia sp.]|jgi:thiol-disulfide isomerase/thioredoxin